MHGRMAQNAETEERRRHEGRESLNSHRELPGGTTLRAAHVGCTAYPPLQDFMLDESFKTSRAVPGLDDRVVAHLGSLLARSMHGKVASFEKGSLPPLRLRRPEASSTWSSPFSSFGRTPVVFDW
eukprot:s5983_g3.t1